MAKWGWVAVVVLGCGGRSDLQVGGLTGDGGVRGARDGGVAADGGRSRDAGGASDGAADALGERDAGGDVSACTETCTGTCDVGGCTVIVETLSPAAELMAFAVRDAEAYLLLNDGIAKASIAGGPLTMLAPIPAADSTQYGVALAADGTDVYVATVPADEGLPGTILRVPIDGGMPTTLATQQSVPVAVAVDSSNVYWATSSEYLATADGGFGGPTGSIVELPKGGGTPVTLASGQSGLASFAVDATSVYWTTAGAGTGPVMKAAIDGGGVTTLASQQTIIPADQAVPGNGLAVDDASVYYTTASPMGAVVKVSKNGGTPVTLATSNESVDSLAIDGANVYWSARFGLIMKIPKSGGSATTVEKSEEESNLGIAVDGPSVYWSYGPLAKTTPTCACP